MHWTTFARRGLLAAVLALAAPAWAGADGYGFVVDVTLSAKAAALLKERHEEIIVFAGFEGVPVPAKEALADGEGLIGLGNEEITIPGQSGRAVVTGRVFKHERLGWVEAPMVLVNVYTARKSGPDNLLDCDAFHDSVAKAQQGPIPIYCHLIGEGRNGH